MSQVKTVVVFGGSGLLGTALIPALKRADFTVIAPPHAEIDITHSGRVSSFLQGKAVQTVINLAAQSHVDRAEHHPEEAFLNNSAGADNLARAAAEGDWPLMHISTNYVFDGLATRPYREADPTGVPLNQYGKSKLLGEQLVREAWHKHYIVRVSALFGAGRSDFVDWVIDQGNPEKPLNVVRDRFITPTWTTELAGQLIAILRSGSYGTYHAAGDGVTSWFDLAREVLRLAGKDPNGVVPVADADLKSPARRPPFSALDNHQLRLQGLNQLRPWQEGLATHLAARGA